MAKFQNLSSGNGSIGVGVNASLFPITYGSVNILAGSLVCFYTAGPSAYSGADTARYDLTDSYLVSEVTTMGNQALVSWEAYPMQLSFDTDNNISFVVTNGSVLCYKKIATVGSVVASFTYVALEHRYFRIRESEGTIYWDTSPDGIAWTNRATELVSALFDVTSLEANFVAGCYAAELTDTTMGIESINHTKKKVDGRFFKNVRPAIFTPGRAR